MLNTTIVIVTSLLLLVAVITTATRIAYASPYSAGYDHGCSDGRSGGHPYLDTPGKGPSFHTGEFMQGYNEGYSACSGGGAHASSKANFIVKITFVDSPNRQGPTDVRAFIQEHPQYATPTDPAAFIDLLDAMYDDDPSTPDGQYTTQIVMPSGLINNGETFHVCLKDANTNAIAECHQLINEQQKGPEEVTFEI